MKLSDLLVDAWVALPLEAGDLGEALQELLWRVYRQGLIDEGRAEKFGRDLATGAQGEVVRVNDQVIAVMGSLESLEGPSVAVGVAGRRFPVVAEGGPGGGEARAVVLVLVPGALTVARQDIVPAVVKALRDPSRTEQFLQAGSADGLRTIKELMNTDVNPRLLVEDALVPVQYRVYPDTPLAEVVDLIVRRGIHAVPVVGEQYEVLGILTSGDALAYSLNRTQGGNEIEIEGGLPSEASARDFMTRTVLCVSEDQALEEAGNMMVKRDVEQLPVVREGELVGFVTRDSVLRALHGVVGDTSTPESESEADI